MSASDNLSNQLFKHTWKKGEGQLGEKATVSQTPHGEFVITQGFGKLKWALNVYKTKEDKKNAQTIHESLGTTKREVLADADMYLKRKNQEVNDKIKLSQQPKPEHDIEISKDKSGTSIFCNSCSQAVEHPTKRDKHGFFLTTFHPTDKKGIKAALDAHKAKG